MSWVLAADREVVGRARAQFRTFLEDSGCVDTYPAELVLSDLVTNAVVNAESEVTVTVRREQDGGVRIEVRDDSDKLPMHRHAESLDPAGRDISVIERLSRQWGIESIPTGGKVVWSTLVC